MPNVLSDRLCSGVKFPGGLAIADEVPSPVNRIAKVETKTLVVVMMRVFQNLPTISNPLKDLVKEDTLAGYQVSTP